MECGDKVILEKVRDRAKREDLNSQRLIAFPCDDIIWKDWDREVSFIIGDCSFTLSEDEIGEFYTEGHVELPESFFIKNDLEEYLEVEKLLQQ